MLDLALLGNRTPSFMQTKNDTFETFKRLHCVNQSTFILKISLTLIMSVIFKRTAESCTWAGMAETGHLKLHASPRGSAFKDFLWEIFYFTSCLGKHPHYKTVHYLMIPLSSSRSHILTTFHLKIL